MQVKTTRTTKQQLEYLKVKTRTREQGCGAAAARTRCRRNSRIHSREVKHTHRKTQQPHSYVSTPEKCRHGTRRARTQTFTAPPGSATPTWNHPNVGNWRVGWKVWCSHTREHHVAVRRNCGCPKVVGQKRRTQKSTYWLWLRLYEIPDQAKLSLALESGIGSSLGLGEQLQRSRKGFLGKWNVCLYRGI